MKNISIAIATIAGATFCTNVYAMPVYQITHLDTSQSTTSYALAINAAGESVGSAEINGTYTPVIFGADKARSLDDIGTNASAVDINDNGTVLISIDREEFLEAMVYKDGTATSLGFFYPNGINNNGQIVGAADDQAIIYDNGAMTPLGTLNGSYSYGRDINNRGQVVGDVQTSTGAMHAFIYDGERMTDLGTIEGYDSSATAINDAGQIAGDLYQTGDNAASNSGARFFTYDGSSMTAVDGLGGSYIQTWDMNNAGQIVGRAENAEGAERGFLYSEGQLYDLNDLLGNANNEWEIVAAYGINDEGKIVGEAIHNGDHRHAFLMSPVPVPPSVWLFGTGLAFVAARSTINPRGQNMALTAPEIEPKAPTYN